MNCNYCNHAPTQHSVHYKISNVRERFIPTYAHSQIFVPQSQSVNVRCTPTFHSSAMDVQGYQTKPNQKNLVKTEDGKTVYKNQSKEKRQNDLNPGTSCPYNFNHGSWYDPAKGELFDSLNDCSTRYSRERKLADLSSNPVFGGGFMEPHQFIRTTCQENPKEEIEQEQKNVSVEVEVIEPQQKKSEIVESKEAKAEIIKDKTVSGAIKKDKASKPVQGVKVEKRKRPDSSQRYILSQDVTLCSHGCSSGRKLAKAMILGSQNPAYTVFRGKRA